MGAHIKKEGWHNWNNINKIMREQQGMQNIKAQVKEERVMACVLANDIRL